MLLNMRLKAKITVNNYYRLSYTANSNVIGNSYTHRHNIMTDHWII